MRTIAIIQARLGSKRFPGKVLEKLGGDTVLGHCIKRAKKIRGIDRLIVATGSPSRNARVCLEATRHNVPCFTHDDENNVLERFLACAEHNMAHFVLRICGDIPFLNVQWAEEIIKEKEYDYVAHYLNDEEFPTVYRYAWGCQSELVKTAALFTAHYADDITEEDREHVTPYIYKHPELFKIKKVPILTIPTTISIDTEQDLRWAQKIIKES